MFYFFRRDLGSLFLTRLIDVYSKCRRVDIGYRIFKLMRGRDDVSWAMIMDNGCYWEILELLDQLKGADRRRV